MPEHVSSPELDVSHFRTDPAILEFRFTAVIFTTNNIYIYV